MACGASEELPGDVTAPRRSIVTLEDFAAIVFYSRLDEPPHSQ
jgi:hypothetical protein